MYPNLEYRTVLDQRVREEHVKLHGVIRPIDDSFWDTHYPPNGWRCRCSVRSSDKEVTPTKKIPKVPIHKHFRHNVGKTGQIFDEKQHPYYKYIHNCQDNEINAAVSKCKKMILKQMEKAKLTFPLYKVRYTSKIGAKVYVSKFADRKDLFGNYKDAIKIADSGTHVYITPHVIIKFIKNAEYKIKGLIADRFVPKSLNGIQSGIKQKVKAQKCEIVVINITEIKASRFDIARKIKGEMLARTKLKEIFVITGNEVIHIERKIIKSDAYWNKMLKRKE